MTTQSRTTGRHRPVIRVFVSSTFSDMKHERNALHEHVFPRLEEMCLKHGFQFQAIDLRWGVSTEAGLDHRAMRICFEELRRAQDISPEPNFLILLGDRYGWRPLPEAISHTEFEALAVAARTGGEKQTPLPGTHDKTALHVLKEWYLCDENVVLPDSTETDPDRVPLNYLLQPRTQNLRDGRDYKHSKDDPTKDTQDWMDVLEVLWRLFNAAFPSKGRQWFREMDWPQHIADVHNPLRPKRAIPQIARLQASATEQEIWCGALAASNAETHVIACFREITNRNEFSVAEAKDYYDIVNGEFDADSAQRQSDLKAAVKLRLSENSPLTIPFSRLKRENGHVVVDAAEADTKAFCDAVIERFRPVIERQIEEYWNKSEKNSPARVARELKIEHDEHERFGRERGGKASFVGRETELSAIRSYLSDNNRWPLVVHGSSGCGKTALMWRAFEDIPQVRKPIIRLIGTTPHSSDLRSLLTSLCQELRQRSPREGALSADIKELRDEFSQHLQAATPEQPLIVFLDALDQLADADNILLLNWLPPDSLPAHVKLVVSCLSDRAAGDPAGQPYAELTHRTIPAENFINLDVLSEAEARVLLLDRWLPKAGRKISDDQRARIEQRLASPSCRLPIFLKLLFEEVHLWHSYDPTPMLGESVPALLGQLFDRLSLETNHGPLLVNRVLGYLSASRHGLAENEILEILFADPEYRAKLNEATAQTRHELPPNAKRIPIALWSRLRFDLAPYLTERAAAGADVLTFYHRQVAEWIRDQFELAGERHREAREPTVPTWQAHPRLAKYFTACAKGTDPQNEWATDSVRGFSECVFHSTKAGQHAQAVELLTNFPFLIHKLRVGLLEGVFEDYALVRHDRRAHLASDNLDICSDFFREKSHILRRGNDDWPAYKILLQLAVEHADDSPLTTAAEKWLQEDHCDWLWLRRVQRLSHLPRNPCQIVFEGHTDSVRGARALADGRMMSWSNDKTLRIWDTATGLVQAVLTGHREFVFGGVELQNGHILSWSGDESVRLWDSRSGQPIAVWDEMASDFGEVLELPDGRLLTWSWNGSSFRLWDAGSGRALGALPLAVQPKTEKAAICLTNGSVLIWSGEVFCLWDPRGDRLVALSGHSRSIIGARELRDGRILSWSWDRTARIWEGETGTLLANLTGHTSQLNGAQELNDGRILSWAEHDKTLRLWDGHTGACLAVIEGAPVQSPKGSTLEMTDGRFLLHRRASEEEEKSLEHFANGIIRNSLLLWDGREGTPVVNLVGHSRWVRGVLTLADDRLLSWGDKIIVWDTRTGEAQAVLDDGVEVEHVLPLPDDRLLAWSQSSNRLRLWDTRRRVLLAGLEGHTSRIDGVVCLADGRLLSWSDLQDHALRIWSLAGEVTQFQLPKHSDAVNGMLLLSDGRLASWGGDSIRFWDRETGGCLGQFVERPPDRICQLISLPDGRFLSRSWGAICLWDERDPESPRQFQGHESSIRGMLLVDGRRFLSWSDDYTLRLWDLGSPTAIAVIDSPSYEVYGALLAPDGSILGWSSHVGFCKWDASGKGPAAWFEGHKWSIKHVQRLPDGRLLSMAVDNDLRVWDYFTAECLLILPGERQVSGVQVLSARHILSWEHDWDAEDISTMRLWDGFSCKPLAVMPCRAGRVRGGVMLTDDRLLSITESGNYQLWCLSSGELLLTLTEREVARQHPEWLYRQATSTSPAAVASCFHLTSHGQSVVLRHRDIPHELAVWQTDSDLTDLSWQTFRDDRTADRVLLPDGTMVLGQDDGQLCILKLHRGSDRISLAQAEVALTPVSPVPEAVPATPFFSRDVYLDVLRHGLEVARGEKGVHHQDTLGYLVALAFHCEEMGRHEEMVRYEAEWDAVRLANA